MRFVIHALPLSHLISGSVALHKLADNLRALGEAASMSYEVERVASDDVVVYPETTTGNPLGAHNTVRWLLSTPGEFSKDRTSTFGGRDLIFSFSAYYERQFDHPNLCGLLTAYDWRLPLWENKGWERTGACYVVRKGYKKERIYHPPDAVPLDGYKNLEALSDDFNRYAHFISYDDQTMLPIFASLCGCPSVVIPNELTGDDWRRYFPYFEFGIAYGFSELQRAEETLSQMRGHLNDLEVLSLFQTETFINVVKEWAI